MLIDVAFSIGFNCTPASHLQRQQMRKFAGPLDWLRQNNMDKTIGLLENGFDSFLQKEIICTREEKNSFGGPLRMRWHDKENDLWVLHGYKKDGEIVRIEDLSFSLVRKWHAHKYEKIKYCLENASRVLVVRSEPNSVSDDIIQLKKRLDAISKAEIVLLHCRNHKEYVPTKELEYIDVGDKNIISFSLKLNPIKHIANPINKWSEVLDQFTMSNWIEDNKDFLLSSFELNGMTDEFLGK